MVFENEAWDKGKQLGKDSKYFGESPLLGMRHHEKHGKQVQIKQSGQVHRI